MVDNMTSTFSEAVPLGLLLYRLWNLTCGSAVANGVEGVILYGISDITLWSQWHKNPLLPTTLSPHWITWLTAGIRAKIAPGS